jgi:hypothetical protein
MLLRSYFYVWHRATVCPKKKSITVPSAIEKLNLPVRQQKINLQLSGLSGHQLGNQPRYNWKQSLASTAL